MALQGQKSRAAVKGVFEADSKSASRGRVRI